MSNVSVQWDQVFADPKAVSLLQQFVAGDRGFRGTIRSFRRDTARTELYRLERAGVASARSRVKSALKNKRS